jgi:hypothetical protein
MRGTVPKARLTTIQAMDLLAQALRGATQPAAPAVSPPGVAAPPPQRLLVAGAGGVLGSAVLAECLVPGRARSVAALVVAPLASTLRGLQPMWLHELDRPQGAAEVFDLALIVLERERRSNGRDDAFHRPDPQSWLPLARRLHAAGARRLVLLLPHAPALLPEALRHGLASHDEAELAALGFEQLLIVRAARPGEDATAATAGLAERLGRLWWQQLRFMVPQREQPLTTAALARCVVRLALRLPLAPTGRTLVLAPDVLWQAHQDAHADPEGAATRFDAWADAFLAGVATR